MYPGRRSSIEVDQESLGVRLLRNNTVLMSAALDVAVPARTWIWKGVNFGFLGCLKISSCGGQIVTYSAHIDMKVAFQGTVPVFTQLSHFAVSRKHVYM
jgi:hypothetical protein